MKRQLYNRELKEMFLKQYPENTAAFYECVLSKAYTTEQHLQKDISNFNRMELESFLIVLGATSLAAITTSLSIITKYIDFAIEKGYVNTRINHALVFIVKMLKNM